MVPMLRERVELNVGVWRGARRVRFFFEVFLGAFFDTFFFAGAGVVALGAASSVTLRGVIALPSCGRVPGVWSSFAEGEGIGSGA